MTIEFITSIAIILFGIFIVLKSQLLSVKLKEFYTNYPLIRYAGTKQLTSNHIYIVIFGIVFILLGSLGVLTNV